MPGMGTLNEYLRDNRITQSEFAARAGLSQSLISRLCNGAVAPTVDRAAHIERLTDGEVPMSSWVTPAPDVSATTDRPASPRPAAGTVNPGGGA